MTPFVVSVLRHFSVICILLDGAYEGGGNNSIQSYSDKPLGFEEGEIGSVFPNLALDSCF
jgi:hypothetical protein